MNVTIYHNPNCSKSRQTLQILQQQNVEIEIIEYLKSGITPQQLEYLLGKLNTDPTELIRTSDALFKNLNLNKQSLTEPLIVTTLLQHPALLQRPIVVANGQAVIARPPEKVHDIL